MDFTLYHLINSRSQRIIWLLEELKLEYDLKIYHQHIPKKQADELKQYNQFAQFPTLLIHNDHSPPTVLTESASILEYLSYTFQQFGIAQLDAADHLKFCFWKNFPETNSMPNMALKQIFHQISQQTPLIVRCIPQLLKYGFDRAYLNPLLHQEMQLIEQHLTHHEWVCGTKFTIADILLWFPLNACFHLNVNEQRYVAIHRYLTQIKNRPAFNTALIKGQWSAETFHQYWAKSNT